MKGELGWIRDVRGEKFENGRNGVTMRKILIVNQFVDICVGNRKLFESF